MGATFSRLKNWIAETLTYADLNAEIDNILTYFTPSGMDDYSTNATQMRLSTDPGEVGTESLATSLAGEIERLRFMILEITGETYWYESSPYSLATLGTSVGGGIPANRIISGKVRTESSQAYFLTPSGSARTITLDATPTAFVYSINSVQYSISADKTITGLTLAPSSNNTCLVNDTGLNGTADTKFIGEYGSELTVDAMGSSVSALVGRIAGFKINNGSANEYFIARVDSTTKLTGIQRGNFFDSTLTNFPRLAISDNNTITLMKLTWVYIDTSGTLFPVYTEPRVSKDEPVSPATGDYWFDLDNQTWKTYSGITWAAAGKTLVGVCMQDSSNCIAARGFDFFANVTDLNTVELEIYDNTEVRAKTRDCSLNVFGQTIKFDQDYLRFDIDTDLDSGLTEAASTLYFLYVTEDGDPIISTTGPQQRNDLRGLYHPAQTWRAVGQVYNNASSNFENVIYYSDTRETNYAVSHAVAASALTLIVHAPPTTKFTFRSAATDGATAYGSVLPGTQFVASNGSTIGTTSAIAEILILHLIRFAGRAELALGYSQSSSTALLTTTAEAGNADSNSLLYSYAARTSVPGKAIASLLSTQATAGVWASALTDLSTGLHRILKINRLTYLSSDTFVVPVDVNILQLFGIGSGGGGGGGAGGVGSEGGGGGGGKGAHAFVQQAVVPGETVTITINSGGAAGAASTIGSDGGITSLVGSSGWALYFQGGGAGGPGGIVSSTNGGAGNPSSFATGGLGGTSGAGGGGGGGGGGGDGVGGKGDTLTATDGTPGYGGGGGGGGAGSRSGQSGGKSIFINTPATGGTAANGAGGGGGGGSGIAIGGNGGNGDNTPTVGANAAANSGAGGGGGGGSGDAGAGAAGGNGGSGYASISWRVA